MHSQRISFLFPFLLVSYEIVTYLSNDMYLPALPTIGRDFNITKDMVQYTLLFWFLGSSSMQLVMGPLSDRYGRRVVLLTGGVFYIIASFICAITDNIYIMLINRFIQGVTVCSVVVSGYSAIHELYDSKSAIKILAIMGSVTILAPALGPLMGAIVLQVAHWRVIFYLLGFGAIITVGLLWKVMPETNPIRIPLNMKDILRDYASIAMHKEFWGYTLPFCLLFMAFICWLVQSPFIVEDFYHRSSLTYGTLQCIIFGGFLIGAQMTQRLIYRFTLLSVINFGMLIALGSAVLLLITNYFFENHIVLVVAAMTILSLGTAITFSPLNRLAIEACSEPMGRRMAVFSSAMGFFGVLGTVLVAFFNEAQMSGLSWLIIGSVVCAFLIFYFSKKNGIITAKPIE